MSDTVEISCADEALRVIKALKEYGHPEYESKLAEIADLFDSGIYEGNWTVTSDFDDVRNIKLIQEDEYDQSLSEDEVEELEPLLIGFCGVYLFWAE